MSRVERNAEINSLVSTFEKSTVVLCADMTGVNVARMTNLRSELRKVNASCKLVKNTLASIAADRAYSSGVADRKLSEADFKKFSEIFCGPTLLITSEADAVAPAKVLAKFVKDTGAKEIALKIKGGLFEGSALGADGVDALSKMPSREEVLSQLLALMSAPATQLLRVMQAAGEQVVRVIDAVKRQKEGQE